MNFEFSHEQQLIAEAVAGRLARTQAAEGGRAAALHLLGELDGLGLFDHEILDCVTATAIAFELGGKLVPVPWADWLAAAIAFAPGTLDMQALASAGRLVACPIAAEIKEAGAKVVGTAVLPMGADAILVAAGDAGSRRWLLVEDGLSARGPLDVLDHSVAAQRVGVDGTGTPLGQANDREFGDVRCLLALGEMVGAARACFRQTVEYARDRKQFGRPVGSYQAVKHMAADAAMQIEAMIAAVQYAAWCADRSDVGPVERNGALLTARAIVGEQAKKIAEDCVQMHGGIAFTWDYGLHHYLKRIVFRRNTLADPRDAKLALAARMAQEPELLENAPLEPS